MSTSQSGTATKYNLVQDIAKLNSMIDSKLDHRQQLLHPTVSKMQWNPCSKVWIQWNQMSSSEKQWLQKCTKTRWPQWSHCRTKHKLVMPRSCRNYKTCGSIAMRIWQESNNSSSKLTSQTATPGTSKEQCYKLWVWSSKRKSTVGM